jgi:hypothetical protein
VLNKGQLDHKSEWFLQAKNATMHTSECAPNLRREADYTLPLDYIEGLYHPIR